MQDAKKTIRLKLVIQKINDIKMKLGSKIILKKSGKQRYVLNLQRRRPVQPKEKEWKMLLAWDKARVVGQRDQWSKIPTKWRKTLIRPQWRGALSLYVNFHYEDEAETAVGTT